MPACAEPSTGVLRVGVGRICIVCVCVCVCACVCAWKCRYTRCTGCCAHRGEGGQDRTDRELRPEPTPLSHLHPRFLLPSLTVTVTRWIIRPNHLRGAGGFPRVGKEVLEPPPPPRPHPRRC